MIITHLIGGLGNQMFQYAAGRACSLQLETSLKVDTRHFAGYQLHQGFELDRLFSYKAELASDAELASLLGWQKSRLAQRILRKPKFKFFRNHNYVVEPHFSYWSDFNQLKNGVYIDGYWQSEQYFSEYADIIRADFTFKLPLSSKNKEISNHISQFNSVSLHVRRGDYVTNVKNSYIGLCSLEYYKEAIKKIYEMVDTPIFYVFSDDINWVKSNLTLDSKSIFVSHNLGKDSYNDMRLMSLCKHHIIANSSFSWWGAWLNPHPNKIVIAPKKWFAGDINDIDLVPSNWIKL